MKMILGLTVKAEYHWGYWIRTPFSSKLQATLPLPPPTTLLGALASYLAREGLLKDPSGKKISGEILSLEIKMKRRSRIDFRSPASILDDALITAYPINIPSSLHKNRNRVAVYPLLKFRVIE